MKEFKTKDMVIQFTNAVNNLKEKDNKEDAIYANLLGLLESFINVIKYEIKYQRLTKNVQVIGLFNVYHEQWKRIAKGVNFNIGDGTMKSDGLKTYLISQFPSSEKDIEERLK